MADIRTRLILDNRQYNTAIDESKNRTQGLNSGLGNLAKGAVVATKAIAALAVGIKGAAVISARFGAQIADTSAKLGIGAEFLQEFRFAAEQVGVSAQTADMALQRFTRRAAEAAMGTGEARDALRQLGIQLRDSQGRLRPTEDLIMDVADAFTEVESQSERVRLAFKLFDSEGVALVNVLNNGSSALQDFARRAQELNGVLSEQDTQTLKSLDDSYTELGVAVRGVANDFVVALAPALEEANIQMAELLAANENLAQQLGTGVGEALQTMAKAARLVAENIDVLRNAVLTFIGVKLFNNLQVSIANFNKLRRATTEVNGEMVALTTVLRGKLAVLLLVSAKLALFVGVVVGITAALRKFKDETIEVGGVTTTLGEIFDAVVWKIGQFFKRILQFGPVLKTAFIDALDVVGPTLDAILEAIKFLVNTAINTFMLLPNALMLAFNQMKRIVQGESVSFIAEWQNMFTEMLETDYLGAAGDKIAEILGKVVEEYRLAKEETKEPLRIEITTDNVGDGEEPEAPGQQFSQYTTDFMQGWNQAFKQWRDGVEDTVDFGRQVFKQFTDGLTDVLTDFFMTGKADFRGFLQSILQMIIKSGIQRALAGIFTSLGGGGGIFGSLFGGGRAEGGPVTPNKSYLVGERGPEMFVPNSAGTIVPNDQLGMGQQKQAQQQQVTNNYITNNISAIDSKSVAQLFAENRRTLLGTVQLAQRETPF